MSLVVAIHPPLESPDQVISSGTVPLDDPAQQHARRCASLVADLAVAHLRATSAAECVSLAIRLRSALRQKRIPWGVALDMLLLTESVRDSLCGYADAARTYVDARCWQRFGARCKSVRAHASVSPTGSRCAQGGWATVMVAGDSELTCGYELRRAGTVQCDTPRRNAAFDASLPDELVADIVRDWPDDDPTGALCWSAMRRAIAELQATGRVREPEDRLGEMGVALAGHALSEQQKTQKKKRSS